MSDGVQIRGVIGQIKWSYYIAAALHGYTVQWNEKTGAGTLRGTIVNSDAFKMSQRPLIFVAPTKQRPFQWVMTSHAIDPRTGTVTATLSKFKEGV